MSDLAQLQQALGHRFADETNLRRALTHASRSRENNERLEFLGDRVLGLLIAEWLCALHPDAAEGDLAKQFAALVSWESCAEVGRKAGLGEAMRLSSEARHNGLDNAGPLADCCEAVIAALYLDGGLDAARGFIRKYWQEILSSPPQIGDAKTRLQEWTQARRLGLPEYRVTKRAGPDHAPSFTVEVQVKGHAPQSAEGASKRIAERAAAEAMLDALGGEA